MEKLNKELENKVIQLLTEGKKAEAIELVNKILQKGVQTAKTIVESYVQNAN